MKTTGHYCSSVRLLLFLVVLLLSSSCGWTTAQPEGGEMQVDPAGHVVPPAEHSAADGETHHEHEQQQQHEQQQHEQQQYEQQQHEQQQGAENTCAADCDRRLAIEQEALIRERNDWRELAERLQHEATQHARDRDDLAHRFVELERMHAQLQTEQATLVTHHDEQRAQQQRQQEQEIQSLQQSLQQTQQEVQHLEHVLTATQEELEELTASGSSLTKIVQKEMKALGDTLVAVWERLWEKLQGGGSSRNEQDKAEK